MAHRAQHRVQKLARAADERLTLPILLGSRSLADYQQLRVQIADTEHRLGAPAAELAARAFGDLALQRLPFPIGARAPQTPPQSLEVLRAPALGLLPSFLAPRSLRRGGRPRRHSHTI